MNLNLINPYLLKKPNQAGSIKDHSISDEAANPSHEFINIERIINTTNAVIKKIKSNGFIACSKNEILQILQGKEDGRTISNIVRPVTADLQTDQIIDDIFKMQETAISREKQRKIDEDLKKRKFDFNCFEQNSVKKTCYNIQTHLASQRLEKTVKKLLREFDEETLENTHKHFSNSVSDSGSFYCESEFSSTESKEYDSEEIKKNKRKLWTLEDYQGIIDEYNGLSKEEKSFVKKQKKPKMAITDLLYKKFILKHGNEEITLNAFVCQNKMRKLLNAIIMNLNDFEEYRVEFDNLKDFLGIRIKRNY